MFVRLIILAISIFAIIGIVKWTIKAINAVDVKEKIQEIKETEDEFNRVKDVDTSKLDEQREKIKEFKNK